MKRLFTSESVTEGHPDKVCDYISDKILDECLKQDENSRVAVETIAMNNKIIVAGQLTTKAVIDIEEIVRETLREIGYDNKKTDIDYRSCIVEINITSQSSDIAIGVDTGGARGPRNNIWVCL
jgi:S-adenosylmethionine synthetase